MSLDAAKDALKKRILGALQQQVLDELGEPEQVARQAHEQIPQDHATMLEAKGALKTYLLQDIAQRSVTDLSDVSEAVQQALEHVGRDHETVRRARTALKERLLKEIALRSAQELGDEDTAERFVQEHLLEDPTLVLEAKQKVKKLLMERILSEAIEEINEEVGPSEATSQDLSIDELLLEIAEEAEQSLSEAESTFAVDEKDEAEPDVAEEETPPAAADDETSVSEPGFEHEPAFHPHVEEAETAEHEPVDEPENTISEQTTVDTPEAELEEEEGETFDAAWKAFSMAEDEDKETQNEAGGGGDGLNGMEVVGLDAEPEETKPTAAGTNEIQVRIVCDTEALQEKIQVVHYGLESAIDCLPMTMLDEVKKGMALGSEEEMAAITKHVRERCHRALMAHANDSITTLTSVDEEKERQVVLEATYAVAPDDEEDFRTEADRLAREYSPESGFQFTVTNAE